MRANQREIDQRMFEVHGELEKQRAEIDRLKSIIKVLLGLAALGAFLFGLDLRPPIGARSMGDLSVTYDNLGSLPRWIVWITGAGVLVALLIVNDFLDEKWFKNRVQFWTVLGLLAAVTLGIFSA